MPEINLTNRKTAAPKVLSMFDKKVAPGETYKAKFSEAYQPAGHVYTESFDILKLVYLFKYHLLTRDDIFIYETLQTLCKTEIPFCLEILADELGMGDKTLRDCLDNLENADLLEIYKTDSRGAGNFYILRTPYFERDSIELTGDEHKDKAILNRHKAIHATGGTIPTIFIETELPRLQRQIKSNRAKRLRTLARRNFTKSKTFRNFKRFVDDKKISWFKIVRRAGSNRKAADIENIIYGLSRSITRHDSNYELFAKRFKESISAAGIEYSRELLEDAKTLVAFYDRHSRHRDDEPKRSAPIKSPPPAAAPIADDGDDKAEFHESFLRKVLTEKTRAITLWSKQNIADTVRIFRDWGKTLDLATCENIALETLPENIAQKIVNELRN